LPADSDTNGRGSSGGAGPRGSNGGAGRLALTGTVTVEGTRLGYDIRGAGPDTVVLLPALLMSRQIQAPLARSLSLRRMRVICIDYLGDRTDGEPHRSPDFSNEKLAALILGALDQLGVGRAVIGGTSIGSNIALEAALQAPGRFTGLLLEGPFLDNAAGPTALGFSALYALVTIGGPALRLASIASRSAPASRAGRALRRAGVPSPVIAQDPARAAAFLRGLMFGRVGPARDRRSAASLPALVIGFPLDPFHPMTDARELADTLPDARLIRTSSIADLRFRPEHLAGEIARFVGDCRRAQRDLRAESTA
jgi:pimeloyl-ACP methyl ester carboxylesterase